MAVQDAINARLPDEYLARLLHNEQGARELSQSPGSFFQAKKRLPDPEALLGISGLQREPLAQLMKGMQ